MKSETRSPVLELALLSWYLLGGLRYVSTTSDNKSVTDEVFKPHFKRHLSSAEQFFKLQPNKEYFSLLIPV